MKNKILYVPAVAFTMVLGMAAVSSANAPPWPVNQKLYIPDGVFDNLTQPDCRLCHEDPLVAFNGANIPNRHHLLVENPAKHINCDFTAAIEADCPTDNGKEYACLDCHSEVWNPVTFSWDLVQNFRDCLNCHQQVAGATVHHLTQAAQTSNCKKCHAPIDNPWAWEAAQVPPVPNHYIPTYATTMITPKIRMGNGTNDPITPTIPASNKRGGCAFCHGPLPLSAPLPDTATGILVYDNARTHHTIGLIVPPGQVFEFEAPAETRPKCTMCHNINAPSYNIRGCEQCHSVKSLHNIQADSPNPANPGSIVVGAETAYYGHIGANADCNGCHLNATLSAAAPYSGAVIPDVFDISKYTVTAGVDTAVTVTGAALTNTTQGQYGPIVVASNVVLTAADGSKVTLTPGTVTETTIDVILPATLAAGNYELRAVKGLWASGPIVVAVKPAVTIDSATCSDGNVVILGSGFSQNIDATGSGTGATQIVTTTVGKGRNKTTTTATEPCSINMWTDTDIEADCGTCGGTIEVNSVFGSDTAVVPVAAPVAPPKKTKK